MPLMLLRVHRRPDFPSSLILTLAIDKSRRWLFLSFQVINYEGGEGSDGRQGNVLIRIKRAVLAGRYAFSEKARLEMETDGLTELDIAESILNAVEIYKTVRSGTSRRARVRDISHIIQSTNLSGLPIYSKGKLVKEAGEEHYYFLISSKRAL